MLVFRGVEVSLPGAVARGEQLFEPDPFDCRVRGSLDIKMVGSAQCNRFLLREQRIVFFRCDDPFQTEASEPALGTEVHSII